MNDGLQLAVGSLSRDKQGLEGVFRQAQEKTNDLTTERDKWKQRHRAIKLGSERRRLESQCSLDKALEKVKSLQDKLNNQLEDTRMLQWRLLASEAVIAKKDSETKTLIEKNEKKHVEMMALDSAYSSLRKRCNEQQTSSEVHVQQALLLNNSITIKQRHLASLSTQHAELELRCKILESSAEGSKGLQRADAKSCKSVVFPARTISKEEADKFVVSDIADYFKQASGENIKSLALLAKVLPPDKRLLTVLVKIILEAKEKIGITAGILRQHGRVMSDRK